jgi:hypothetical protein
MSKDLCPWVFRSFVGAGLVHLSEAEGPGPLGFVFSSSVIPTGGQRCLLAGVEGPWQDRKYPIKPRRSPPTPPLRLLPSDRWYLLSRSPPP